MVQAQVRGYEEKCCHNRKTWVVSSDTVTKLKIEVKNIMGSQPDWCKVYSVDISAIVGLHFEQIEIYWQRNGRNSM